LGQWWCRDGPRGDGTGAGLCHMDSGAWDSPSLVVGLFLPLCVTRLCVRVYRKSAGQMKLFRVSIQPASHMSVTPVKALLATPVLGRTYFPKSHVGQIPLQPGAALWGPVWFPLSISVVLFLFLGRCCSSCRLQLLWAAQKAETQRESLEPARLTRLVGSGMAEEPS